MRGRHVGVMIARGDLAVECGFERLAEVQEEILWICEAAHVAGHLGDAGARDRSPRTGSPSRAEITDAAMGRARRVRDAQQRAALVREAVRALDDILARMEAHQYKKRAMLRPLHVAHAVSLDLSTPPIYAG